MPADTYTANKNLIQPGHGNYQNNWDSPLNSDFGLIDTAFGGLATIPVTGGAVTLSIAQYQPPNLIVTGTLTSAVTLAIPSGVGGLWTVLNSTNAAYTVTLTSGGGGRSVLLLPNQRFLVVSDGTNVDLADGEAGSFSGQLTGMTAGGGTVGGIFTYRVRSGVCTLTAITQVNGTSNTNAMTLTGLPAACQPATGTPVSLCGVLINNGNGAQFGGVTVNGSTVTFAIWTGTTFGATSFAASGLKGVQSGWTITYPLD